jgi:hypothetical protein
MHRLLYGRPLLERALSYSAIAAMLAVPLAFCSGNQTALLAGLGGMLVFHASTSLIMGLNDFLYTFPLAYAGAILGQRLLYGF